MNRIFRIIFCLFFIFFLCSCSSNNIKLSVDEAVAYKLQQLDENYSNETLNSLAIIIKSNYYLDNNYLDFTNHKVDKKYINIVSLLNDTNIQFDSTIDIDTTNNDNSWVKTINKSDILEYSNKKNISLSNVSNIEPTYENDKLTNIKIGGNIFSFKELRKEFNLKSDNINNISQNHKSIIFSGIGEIKDNSFNIKEAEKLSNSGKSYKEILETIL